MMSNVRALFVLGALALAGCGGGGGGGGGTPAPTPPPPAPASTAEGLWIGSTSNGRTMTALVLDDGSFWALYSWAGNPSLIAGVIQGSGTSNNGSFSSANTRDFNLEGQGILNATVSASYQVRQTLNGSVNYGVNSVSFTANYSAAYEQTPSLASLAGVFSGQVATSLGVENASANVTAAGAISGVGQTTGCTVTGTAAPRGSGNAFNVSLTFGPAPCFFPNQTLNGIGYYDAPGKRLYAAVLNASRTDGVLFVGTKP